MTPPRNSGFSVSLLGILYGLIYSAGAYLSEPALASGMLPPEVIEGFLITVFMPLSMYFYWRISYEKIIAPLIKLGIGTSFHQHEPYTYLVFLLAAGFLFGIKPSIAFTIALMLLLILSQAGVFIFGLDKQQRLALVCAEKYIAALFMVSGFSALIYQVVWQRALFTTFGVNSESVTVVVSVFMFGLGLGSLAGGYLQERFPRRLLHLFLLLEIGIGIFGLFSLDLIHAVGRLSGETSTTSLVLWTYGILALPTLLMGATLPILVALMQGRHRNFGRTVGLLYAFNTFGSAVASFCTVGVLFVFFGQQTTVFIAAACNFITAYLVYDASKKLVQANAEPLSPPAEYPDEGSDAAPRLPYALIFTIVLATGYISLSQELLWFRLLGYMTADRPQTFGMLLTAFLIGIAGGSLQSKKMCESGNDCSAYLVRALACAIAIFYLSVPLIADATVLLKAETSVLLLAYVAVAAVAFLAGGILPMLIHIGIGRKQTRSTLMMAWLYFANIAGATIGPLLTGFILLDRFTLEQNVVILTGASMLLLLVIVLAIPKQLTYKVAMVTAMVAIVSGAWFAHPHLYQGYLEKIHYAAIAKPFKHQFENRSGIITAEAGDPDILFGNGAYDGRFNTDPVGNSNLIDRAYMIAALHRRPRNVLEIGLSTGSWTKVIADYEPLEKLTVVEINKGYPEIVRHYSRIASVLDHPKVTLFFDDGRRWLRNHPGKKFDLVVINTTHHWRSNATNLLSKEFLELCKSHLNPGGVVYYNTTGSPDVVYTAAQVFDHVTMYGSFVAVSDAPFDMTTEEKKGNLLNFLDSNNAPLFNRDEQYHQKLNQLAKQELNDLRQRTRDKKNLWIVTDDNMAVEYKNARVW